MALGEARFLDLLDLIYAAALDARGWPAALSALADAFRGSGVLWSQDLGDARVGLIEWGRYDRAAIRSYVDYCAGCNLWLQRPEFQRKGALVTDESLDSRTFQSSEFFNDYLRPNDFRHGIGFVVENDGVRSTQVSVLRPELAGRFSEAEQAQFALLAEHVGRAVQVHRRLFAAEMEASSAEELLARAGVGVALVDGVARLIFANAAAQRRFGGADGLVVAGDRLAARDGEADQRLKRLVFQAARTAQGRGARSGGVAMIPRKGGKPIALLICPFRGQGFAGGAPGALIFVHAPEDAAPAPARALAELWGLTPTEARLAEALVAGRELSAWAEEAGVAIATARAHLARVLRKAEARSQAEVVRLALGNPAIAWPRR